VRIVSLLPSATDAVVALGGGEMLVGISHSCDAHVPHASVVTSCEIDADASSASIDAAVREIKTEGRTLYALDAARIEALAPDLILTQGLCEVCAVSEAEVHRLAAKISSQPKVVSLSGGTFDQVIEDLATIGAAIGLADEAEELTMGLRRRVRVVHETLKAAQAPRPRVVVLEWTDPFFSGGHWVPEQVKRAGGVDLIGTIGEHSRVVTLDELRAADPEIVIVAPCGFDLERSAVEGAALKAAHPWLAVKECWAVDANSLTSRPGPRIVDGIEAMARIFAPSLFTPLSSSLARRL
jgi:iron complex transport system substrate-binding protein